MNPDHVLTVTAIIATSKWLDSQPAMLRSQDRNVPMAYMRYARDYTKAITS